MTLAKTIVELIEIHDPRLTAARDKAGNQFHIMDEFNLQAGARVDFDNHTNNQAKALTERQEYRHLLSVATLQLKLSKSLEYDLEVIPTRVANQFNAVHTNLLEVCCKSAR